MCCPQEVPALCRTALLCPHPSVDGLLLWPSPSTTQEQKSSTDVLQPHSGPSMELSRSFPSCTQQDLQPCVARACLPQCLGTAPAGAREVTFTHQPWVHPGWIITHFFPGYRLNWESTLFAILVQWPSLSDLIPQLHWYLVVRKRPIFFFLLLSLPLKNRALLKLDKNIIANKEPQEICPHKCGELGDPPRTMHSISLTDICV